MKHLERADLDQKNGEINAQSNLNLVLTAQWIRIFIYLGVPILAALSIMMTFVKAHTDNIFVVEVADRFILNNETSVPTVFSFLMMLAASQLAFLTFLMCRKDGKTRLDGYWMLISLILVFLAFDEAAQIHEMLRWSVVGGLLGDQSWIFVGAPVFAVIGIIFLPFLLSPPRQLKLRLVKGALIFFFGAIIVEGIQGYYSMNFGKDPLFIFTTTLEESLELVGVAYLILAFLEFAAEKRLALHFTSESNPLRMGAKGLMSRERN